MFNLSPRWKELKTTTSVKLAPNHYYIDSEVVYQNRVPFLSAKERKSTILVKCYTDAVYNVDVPPVIIGGSSMRSRSKRSTKPPDDTPGPTKYNPQFIPKKTTRVIPAPAKGKRLYVCKVPYSLEAVGPSVPTTIDENGYSLDSTGRWIKNPADEYDRTLGPAYYQVQTCPCLTTAQYKGCRWSLRQSRDDIKTAKSEGPGPGAYDARYKKTVKEDDEYVREMARLYSFAPRYLDMVERKLKRDDFPGPDAYDLTSSEANWPKSLSLNPAGFGARSERSSSSKSCTPSANKYNVSGDLLKRSVSIKDTAFNVLDDRFKKNTRHINPGPGNYVIPSVIEEKLQKSLAIHIETRPPFNHSSERVMVPSLREQRPGPAHYIVEALQKEPGRCEGSVFRSATRRFKPPKYMKCAEPASFSVSEPFNKNRDRKSHNVGRVPFQSTRPRRQAFRTSSFGGPDPCKYKVHEDMQTKGFYFAQSPRFAETEETPGPGSYKIHPSVDVSTYKAMATHNLRLKEFVLRSKLRLSPDDTREEWLKEIKKRKQLLAFYKPPPKKIASWITIQ